MNLAESKNRQYELRKTKLSREERKLQQEIYMLEMDLQQETDTLKLTQAEFRELSKIPFT